MAPVGRCTFFVVLAALAARVGRADLIYERRIFPQKAPLVCATLVSHRRFDLLERTMVAAMRHFEHDEPPWLTYEIAWFDNGSGEAARAFAERVQAEHIHLSEHNLGLPAAINALVRRLCRAPFLLTLEEDWEFGGDGAAGAEWLPSPGAPAVRLLDTPARRTAVASAAALLAAEAAEPRGLADVADGKRMPILGVTLRSETLDMTIREPRRSAWTSRALLAPREAGEFAAFWFKTVEYRTYCLDWRSGQVFGAYTNGAALYNRSRLIGLGPMYGDSAGVPNPDGGRIFHDSAVSIAGYGFPSHYGESNYALRAGMQYCSATLRLEAGCDGTPDVVGGTCSAAFVHTGHGRGYGLEKHAAARTESERDPIWLYAGTPLLDAALAIRRLAQVEGPQHALAGLQAAATVALSSNLVQRHLEMERTWGGTRADALSPPAGGSACALSESVPHCVKADASGAAGDASGE
ncbi:hypothetical protein KFE25_010296 [Diacronema lutheri]|uniref:Glycosyltransferase 2-like domain-containing protein n=1 Tax=Diacronema lutheri TaxID=2081491 RepID=A0A8J6C908_DIALT|nr:hypothetical protein KFE25_010296 [Diacronema lutheri]